MSTLTEDKSVIVINPMHTASVEVEIPSNLRVWGDTTRNLPPGHKLFRVINQKDGDKRIVWDSHSLAEINEAKRLFDNLVEQGMTPYAVDPQGKRSATVLAEFSPDAEEIVFAPIAALVGG